ncbi:DUF4251 domain-containing protein [Pedobacter sp.]|uniref:DUF4251 domain-containing protein n=1 Tax=Pedobacter sp. TaxID=1411316 RepID=UPI003D7F3CC2
MKTLKNYMVAVMSILCIPAFAQTDKATTEKIIENQDFVFVATTAMPLSSQDVSAILYKLNSPNSSGAINLSGSRYDLVVKKDSVVAYLPFYGRSYSANLDPNEAGIKFNSKSFSYEKTKRKKGGWNIVIVPKDVKDHQKMTLYVTESGYATLNVMNNNRQPISFNGYLMEAKKKP